METVGDMDQYTEAFCHYSWISPAPKISSSLAFQYVGERIRKVWYHEKTSETNVEKLGIYISDKNDPFFLADTLPDGWHITFIAQFTTHEEVLPNAISIRTYVKQVYTTINNTIFIGCAQYCEFRSEILTSYLGIILCTQT